MSSRASDRHVTRYEMVSVAPPVATETYHPQEHYIVANATIEKLSSAGFMIKSERWTLSAKDQLLFGVVDLNLPLARWDEPGGGVTVSVGIRSSYNKQLPFGIVAGSRVFVCSNLAFAGELTYKRKHTRHGYDTFLHQLDDAILKLPQYQAAESERIQSWMNYELTDDQCNTLLLTLFEHKVIGMRQFHPIMDEFRNPTYEDFQGKTTVWNFFNRITTAMRNRENARPLTYASQASNIISRLNNIVSVKARVVENMPSILTPLALTYEGD